MGGGDLIDDACRGLLQQMDFETTTKKMYDGDYLIMVTDGVLDALPKEREEETMKEIILQVHSTQPREAGRNIMEKSHGILWLPRRG